MNLESFADELLRLRAGESFVKSAKASDMLLSRFGVIGGAAGLGSHALQHGKAMFTGNPWDAPRDTAVGAATKGALGGLTAAGALKLLAMMATKKKRR